MATSLKTVINMLVSASLSNPLDLVTGTAPMEYPYKKTWTNGTTIDKADLVWSDTVTLTASGTADLDLAGSLVSVYGATLTFVELKAIMVVAAAANTNNVNVTRPASNGVPLFLAASDGIAVPPGGSFMWFCPADGKVTVTPATGDLITFTNSAGSTSVTYDVVLIGASA